MAGGSHLPATCAVRPIQRVNVYSPTQANREVGRMVIHAHQHAPSNFIAGYDEVGIRAHDAIDVIKKGPAHAHEINIEHPFWFSAPALKDLVTDNARGRTSAEESACFLNNIDIGLQFAAVGAAVFQAAKAKGIGREIPTDWFLESVHP